MTLNEIRRRFPHASLSFISKNVSPAMGGLLPAEREQGAQPALDQDAPAEQARPSGVVACVSLIRCGNKTLDSDNLLGALKALRDTIARTLGVDDGDERVRWCYGQARAEGRKGVIVKLELL